MVVPVLFSYERFGLRFKEHGLERIQEYIDRERTRPSLVQSYPPHWLESEPSSNFVDAFLEKVKELPK
jgi:hypothetical protein